MVSDNLTGILGRGARAWCPSRIRALLRRLRRASIDASKPSCVSFQGRYDCWDDAVADSAGYQEEGILAKVLAATLSVRCNEKAFERDSVVFDRIEYSWPVVANLMMSAARNSGRLRVIDFGGALGSVFFQNRTFLSQLNTVQWIVVEQPHFVAAGCREVATEELSFRDAIAGDMVEGESVLLLSGVLQYLPDPYATLRDLLQWGWGSVIIDRTSLLPNRATDRLTVQSVPPSIYPASYPAWFLSKQKLLDVLSQEFELLASWKSLDDFPLDGDVTAFEGFSFVKKRCADAARYDR